MKYQTFYLISHSSSGIKILYSVTASPMYHHEKNFDYHHLIKFFALAMILMPMIWQSTVLKLMIGVHPLMVDTLQMETELQWNDRIVIVSFIDAYWCVLNYITQLIVFPLSHRMQLLIIHHSSLKTRFGTVTKLHSCVWCTSHLYIL